MRQQQRFLKSLVALWVAACAGGEQIDVPDCGDGLDNDQDGFIDLADPGCDNTNDDQEFEEGPFCGNNIIEGDEECDGDNLGGKSCASFGLQGTLVCTPTCLFGTEACDPITECNDGIDNDSDGFADSDDPACTSELDTSELVFADSCGASSVLINDLTVLDLSNLSTTGSTAGAPNRFSPQDTSSDCKIDDASAGEVVFSLHLAQPQRLNLSLDNAGTDYDTVLYVRQLDCGSGAEICNDDNGLLGSSLFGDSSEIEANFPAGVIFIFVDGFNGATGNFVLSVTAL